jgi:hypothetical protein
MRSILAVVVVFVLLSGAFASVAPMLDHNLSPAAASSSGLRTAVAPNYSIVMRVVTQPVLPGYHDTLWYDVGNDTTGAPIQTLSTITILGTYYNDALQLLKMPGTPVNVSTTPINTWGFLVPANASAAAGFFPILTVWANSSSLKMNQSSSTEVLVGNLVIPAGDATVCDAITGCGSLTVGNPATVSVTAMVQDVFGGSAPAAGESVKFLFYRNTNTSVTVPGIPATLTTNSLGSASVTFTPTNNIFNVSGPNRVEFEVTDAVNTSLTVYTNVSWHLYNPVGALNFALYLNSGTYYSGQTVIGTWQYVPTNSTIGPINVTNYVAFDTATSNVIADGVIESTAATGTFSFALAGDYVGTFEVYLIVHNSSDEFTAAVEASSSAAILLITPSEPYYNPGDTITVQVQEEGPALAGATVSAFVQSSNSGQTLFNATVTGGSFQFKVPTVAPAPQYEIFAWASTAANGTIAQTSQEIYENSGYSFVCGLNTVSSYADFSFTPGATVSVGYQITALGTSPLPNLIEIQIGALGGAAIDTYWVTSPSGSVPFTVPAGTPNGPQSFLMTASFSTGSVLGLFTVIVDATPSPLNYELIGDSGLTVSLLGVIILAIVVGVLLWRMRRRSKPTPVKSPPGPAPWAEPEGKETGPGGGSTGGSADAPSAPPGAQ